MLLSETPPVCDSRCESYPGIDLITQKRSSSMLKSECEMYVGPGMCYCRRGHWHGPPGWLCQPHNCKELQGGSEGPNSPSLYSPPAVLCCTLCPRTSPPQRQEAERGCGVGAGLCLPHFHVIPWTGLLSPGSKAVRVLLCGPLLCPPARFWWDCSYHRHGTGGSVVQHVSPRSPADGLRPSNALW